MSLFTTTIFFCLLSFFINDEDNYDSDVVNGVTVVATSEIGFLMCSYITHDRWSCTLSGCGTMMATQTRFPLHVYLPFFVICTNVEDVFSIFDCFSFDDNVEEEEDDGR